MLESHDLEGHVAGGQDEDADSANIHTGFSEHPTAYCAASSQVPLNKEPLTRPSRRGGWRVATPAARTGLWVARQNLRGDKEVSIGLKSPLGIVTGKGSVAVPLLGFWLAVWRWTSAWTETSPLFRNVSARWKSAQTERKPG